MWLRAMSSTSSPAPGTLGPVYQRMASKLKTFGATDFSLVDDSAKHAGHAAMKGLNRAETHFRLTVVSPKFQGLPLIARHRLVYSLLDEDIQAGVHALQLTTRTPEEAAKLKS